MRDGSVRVTGKGDKTRVVPVGSRARTAIEAWLPLRAELAGADQPLLFVNAKGRPINPRTVQKRLEMWAVRQGISQHVHPHMLRHSFASHVLQSSGDLRAVQEMLGHASISSTQIYTHLDFQYLAKIYDAAHPGRRKNRVNHGDTESTEKKRIEFYTCRSVKRAVLRKHVTTPSSNPVWSSPCSPCLRG